MIVAVGIFCVAVVWLVTCIVLRNGGTRILDCPKEHSVHTKAIPSAGGSVILLAMLVALGTVAVRQAQFEIVLPFLPLALVSVISFLDDRKSQPILLRLLSQSVAAVIAVAIFSPIEHIPILGGIHLGSGWVAWSVTILWIVGVCNLFNFLDGIDGFACTQGVLAGLGMALLMDDFVLRLWGVALGCACLGFLPFNWMPARVFLGDVGSTSIGFILGLMPLIGSAVPSGAGMLIVVMLLWFFLLDGAATLTLRCLRGERIWRSHQQHFYQKWVFAGMSHAGVCCRVHVCTLLVGLGLYAWGRFVGPILDYTVPFFVIMAIFLGYALRIQLTLRPLRSWGGIRSLFSKAESSRR